MSEQEGVEFVVFENSIPASSERNFSETSPVTGHIFFLALHFPAGCNGNVRVSIGIAGHSTRWPMGIEAFALDDTTLPIAFPPPFHKIVRGDAIDVTVANGDSTQARKPVITLGLIGRQ